MVGRGVTVDGLPLGGVLPPVRRGPERSVVSRRTRPPVTTVVGTLVVQTMVLHAGRRRVHTGGEGAVVGPPARVVAAGERGVLPTVLPVLTPLTRRPPCRLGG